MGMMRARVVIAGLALAAMALPAGAIGTTLHPSVIDSVGDVGEEPSVAIGTDGNPVISYHDATNDTLKVAWCNDPACAGGDEGHFGHRRPFDRLAGPGRDRNRCLSRGGSRFAQDGLAPFPCLGHCCFELFHTVLRPLARA